MLCPYCRSKSNVSNSRSRAKGTQTWRRRSCDTCNSVWTTREELDLSTTHSVVSETSSKPFSRDRLFVSIKDSLQHRKTALEDATALTDTIIAKALTLKTANIPIETLSKLSYEIIRRFDKTAAAVYKAIRRN